MGEKIIMSIEILKALRWICLFLMLIIIGFKIDTVIEKVEDIQGIQHLHSVQLDRIELGR